MSIIEATELFYNYGNVGRSPEDLLTESPTGIQLNDAVQTAILSGVDPIAVYAAEEAIILYFSTQATCW